MKNKTMGDILFWLTMVSPMLAFSLISEVGEVEIFGVEGIVRYSFVMWFFIPIGVLSVFVGKMLARNGEKYKKNYVIAFICLPLLLIFGSFRFIFNTVSYDDDILRGVEERTALDLPDEVKIATHKFEQCNLIYLKITDDAEAEDFEQELENNECWRNTPSSKLESLLPLNIKYEIQGFDFFAFYNMTDGEYNTYPQDGEHVCTFIAYDSDMKRMIIVDSFAIVLN